MPTPPARRFDRSADDRTAPTLAALAAAVRIRDDATGEHSELVARYCRDTALALGLDETRAAEVELAGRLHDLGKVAVPDSILHKPGALTEDEWRIVQQHPETGARIVSTAGLAEVSSWILLHHERPDGRGYPHGLREIPIEAAIVAVADAYQAMTADRVYRSALDEPQARAELVTLAGTQFDARVVDAFLALRGVADAV